MSGWVSINMMKDAPAHDCLVAFTDITQQSTGNRLDDDVGNLGGSVGYLSWSKDKTWWTIIEDGEIVYPHEVTALCEIPMPENIVAGSGVKVRE